MPPVVLTMTLVAPRDPPVRVTSTSAVPLASLTVSTGALSCTVPGVAGCGPAGQRAAGRGAIGGSLRLAETRVATRAADA